MICRSTILVVGSRNILRASKAEHIRLLCHIIIVLLVTCIVHALLIVPWLRVWDESLSATWLLVGLDVHLWHRLALLVLVIRHGHGLIGHWHHWCSILSARSSHLIKRLLLLLRLLRIGALDLVHLVASSVLLLVIVITHVVVALGLVATSAVLVPLVVLLLGCCLLHHLWLERGACRCHATHRLRGTAAHHWVWGESRTGVHGRLEYRGTSWFKFFRCGWIEAWRTGTRLELFHFSAHLWRRICWFLRHASWTA